MATVQPQKIRTKDILPGLEHEGPRKVELTLPAHMSCAAQRDTAEGWAASFSYYEQTCVLRERKKGSIECEADWIEKPGRRERTGCFSKKEAIESSGCRCARTTPSRGSGTSVGQAHATAS